MLHMRQFEHDEVGKEVLRSAKYAAELVNRNRPFKEIQAYLTHGLVSEGLGEMMGLTTPEAGKNIKKFCIEADPLVSKFVADLKEASDDKDDKKAETVINTTARQIYELLICHNIIDNY